MRCIYIECSPVDDSGHIHVRSSTDNVLLAKPLTAVQLKIKNHFVIYQCINDQKLKFEAIGYDINNLLLLHDIWF